MRSMRRRLFENDVAHWADTYLRALDQVPVHPSAAPPPEDHAHDVPSANQAS
jgi:hypothetical protein